MKKPELISKYAPVQSTHFSMETLSERVELLDKSSACFALAKDYIRTGTIHFYGKIKLKTAFISFT